MELRSAMHRRRASLRGARNCKRTAPLPRTPWSSQTGVLYISSTAGQHCIDYGELPVVADQDDQMDQLLSHYICPSSVQRASVQRASRLNEAEKLPNRNWTSDLDGSILPAVCIYHKNCAFFPIKASGINKSDFKSFCYHDAQSLKNEIMTKMRNRNPKQTRQNTH